MFPPQRTRSPPTSHTFISRGMCEAFPSEGKKNLAIDQSGRGADADSHLQDHRMAAGSLFAAEITSLNHLTPGARPPLKPHRYALSQTLLIGQG